MKTPKTKITSIAALAAAAVLIAAACSSTEMYSDDGLPSSDSDSDTDGDMDGDTDGDSDSDGDTDTAGGDTDTQDVDTDTTDCDTENEVVLYLSADDSNSMAGPVVARGLINNGQLVYKALRTYEFLNYYNFDYTPADPGRVNVSAQMRSVDDDSYNLQIGVRAEDLTEVERRRVNVVLAVDTSSSMGWGDEGATGIEIARQLCASMAGSLREGDVVSVVAWGGYSDILLNSHHVSGADDADLLGVCDDLEAYGDTDLHGGLQEAYDLAQDNFDELKINRVVLMSDGGANVGVTDSQLIAEMAEDADGEAIYLMGVGVGDPWNYNDELMNEVTDAGKGAYLFIDTLAEAQRMFGQHFISNVEVAARNVQVELVLPPTFEMEEFHGEEYSPDPTEVEPQHLAMNDAMIFHQRLLSCDTSALDPDGVITVTATYEHPITREEREDALETTLSTLLEQDDALLLKGDAIVAYADALSDVMEMSDSAAAERIDLAIEDAEAALAALGGDPDLVEIRDLLVTYRASFTGGFEDAYPAGDEDQLALYVNCSSCDPTGSTIENMRCAIDLCDDDIYLDSEYTSPTGSSTEGTFAAVTRFGQVGNDISPRYGESFALMATGPAVGAEHSQDMGGSWGEDEFSNDGYYIYNAMEWRLHLRAPDSVNGFRVRHMFLSEEYDDYVGSSFNDKFYIILEAGSTNGGTPTVINFTECRDPGSYYDFRCSPGMQYCNPGQRYCYIAINTAMSECCWYQGCPDGTATTDISGTGYECASSPSEDSAASGSSTGWMTTEWPIEPGEEFYVTFHVHDASDGIFDSEIVLDKFRFLQDVEPGTWK